MFDEDMMVELEEIKRNVEVHQTLLVVDAMTGQDAVTVASQFNDRIGITVSYFPRWMVIPGVVQLFLLRLLPQADSLCRHG